jgi:tetratricopeptide (TPR) repeat protein
VQQGRSEAGLAIHHRALALLDRPDRSGMAPAQHRGLRLGIIYTIGLLEAALGRVGTLERIRELDDAPDYRANAYRVRAVSHFMLGDASAGAECQRQAELLQLQEDAGRSHFGSSWSGQLIARRLMHDLTGVKRALDAISELCELYPCWLPILHWARYEYLRIQGDHVGALAAIECALAITAPARHVNWPQFAEAQVHVLLELDRPGQALAYAERYVAICDRLELAPTHRAMWTARGMALVKLGRHAEGVSQIERSIQACEQIGVRGLIAGHYCEQRARAAIWMKDALSFRQWSERAAREYQRGRNPALAARYARLVQEAERAGLLATSGVVPSWTPPVQDSEQDSAAALASARAAEVGRRMLAYGRSDERARCALESIAAASSARWAHLYGVQGGRLTMLAVLGENEVPEIAALLEQQLSLALREDAVTEVVAFSGARRLTAGTGLALEREGRVYHAIALHVRHEGEPTIVALLALGFMGPEATMPSEPLLAAIARALLDRQDVDPLSCVGTLV